jgi:hypothetical protein
MITFEQVMAWKPCYSQEQVEELFAEREVLTLEDVFNLDISPAHRLWVLLREELISAPVLHEFACRVAEQALALRTNPDPQSVAAIATKRAWLRGEIDEEQLSEAREAVRCVVGDACAAVHTHVGRSLAYYASSATAELAARDAADYANMYVRAAAKYAAKAAVTTDAGFADIILAVETACIAQLELLQTLLKETAQETA